MISSLLAVLSLAFAQAGASGKDPGGDPLPPGAVARLGTVRLRHGDDVQCLAFSPDGRILVSGGRDNHARVWDPKTGREHLRVKGSERWINCLAISPDSKLLATGTYRTVQLWDLATGRELRRLTGLRDSALGLAFSPDGALLAAGDNMEPPSMRIWETSTGLERRAPPGHGRATSSLAFSPDGKVLVTVGGDHRVRVWKVEDGKQLGEVGHAAAYAEQIVLLPGGTRLLVGTSDATAQIVDLEKRAVVLDLPGHVNGTQAVACSPDGTLLATRDLGALRLWEAAGGESLEEIPLIGGMGGLAFSPDGTVLATGSGTEVAIFTREAGEWKRRRNGPEGRVVSVSFSSDGALVASRTAAGDTRAWEASTGKERWGRKLSPLGAWNVAFRPGAHEVLAADEGQILRSWDVDSGEERRARPGGDRWAISPEGRTYVAARGQTDLTVRNLDTGDELRRIGTDFDYFSGLAVSPEKGLLAWSGARWGRRLGPSVLRIWDGVGDPAVVPTPEEAHSIADLAWSPDGGILAAGAWKVVVLLDGATRKEILRIPGWPTMISALAFSPDGARLAVAGRDDAAVRIWGLPEERELAALAGHQGHVNDVAFSADGARLASGGADTSVLVWNVSAPPPGPAGLKEEEAGALWAALSSDNSAVAYRAGWKLVGAPDRAVSWLGGRLREKGAHSEEARRLISELDRDDPAVRDRVAVAIRGLKSETELLRALDGDLPTESRARLSGILLEVERATASDPEAIRRARSLSVLERIGSIHRGTHRSAVVELLEALERSASWVGVRRRARAALGRLSP